MMTNSPEISVIVPCFNEIDNLEPLIAELRAALDPLGRSCEILYIDDHSTDGSYEKLCEMTKTLPILRVVRHSRNYGESAGEKTGFENARGSIIITIDADLQNDPADIPEMLRRLETADAICGVRRIRDDSFSKRISSRIANAVRGGLLNDSIHDAGCTYRALRASALKGLPNFRALHRFIPTIIKWHGYRVEEMLINHRPRTAGKSKYGVGNRLWVGIGDMFAMRWYRRRFFPPCRVEESPK
ncbi:MAG: glycosyltransferase family 2 protein [bacterium]|nr:glycosyltransferase family 2 protein [Candidatus Sumerlaeota bacterium]